MEPKREAAQVRSELTFPHLIPLPAKRKERRKCRILSMHQHWDHRPQESGCVRELGIRMLLATRPIAHLCGEHEAADDALERLVGTAQEPDHESRRERRRERWQLPLVMGAETAFRGGPVLLMKTDERFMKDCQFAFEILAHACLRGQEWQRASALSSL